MHHHTRGATHQGYTHSVQAGGGPCLSPGLACSDPGYTPAEGHGREAVQARFVRGSKLGRWEVCRANVLTDDCSAGFKNLFPPALCSRFLQPKLPAVFVGNCRGLAVAGLQPATAVDHNSQGYVWCVPHPAVFSCQHACIGSARRRPCTGSYFAVNTMLLCCKHQAYCHGKVCGLK